jgi:hypothetical protein
MLVIVMFLCVFVLYVVCLLYVYSCLGMNAFVSACKCKCLVLFVYKRFCFRMHNCVLECVKLCICMFVCLKVFMSSLKCVLYSCLCMNALVLYVILC